MNGFIFTQRYNTPDSPLMRRLGNPILCVRDGPAGPGEVPTHTCDATGSFAAASMLLKGRNAIPQPVLIYDNSLPQDGRRESILTALAGAPANSLGVIAYFGHGTPNGLESAGIHREHLSRLANLVNEKCADNATVVFYACSVGMPGGFAEELGRLAQRGISVWGHISWGFYADKGMFRRYPGGVRPGSGGIYTFWADQENDRQIAIELRGL